jgi:hypothetical protein
MNRFDKNRDNGVVLASYRAEGGEAGAGSGADEHVDRVLRDFFQSAMPDPWPEAPRPALTPVVQRRMPWLRLRSRLALAAAIALVFVGYLVVSAKFPPQEGGGGLAPSGPIIGKGLKVIPLQRDTTDSGVQADSWGVKTPGGATIINVQEVPAKR